MKITQQLGIEPIIKSMQKTGRKSDALKYFYGRFSNTIKIRDFAVPAILADLDCVTVVLHCLTSNKVPILS